MNQGDEDFNSTESDALASGGTGLPGVIATLGELGAGAVIMEEGLAAMFDRHEFSVKRAIERGELPPPVRMFGQNAWTAGVLVRHIEKRLEKAAKEVEQARRKVVELAP
jgi:hypothetical protein